MRSKKESILNAATALFSKSGYHAVGVDLIVAESNVAKMTFYKNFPSKENLIESVLFKRDHDLRTSIGEAVNRSRTPETKIKAIFDWYLAWFESDDFNGCMFIKASEEFPEIETRTRKVSQAHKAWLEQMILKLLDECQVKQAAKLAAHIMIVLDGLTIKMNMFKGGAREEVKSCWDYVDVLIKAG